VNEADRVSKGNILVVEDEAIVAEDLSQKLVRLGYSVSGVTASGAESLALARERRPDLVLMDIRLEGPMDGVEAAQVIRRECDIPVIYLTAHSDSATLQRAKVTEPFGYILKPFETPQLETQIQMALHKHQAEREVQRQREWLRVTLQSIGDAVITTDAAGKVTSLNPVAEDLTGWKIAEALDRPLPEVFKIVNEETRRPAPNPVERVLREGKVVGLANHTALISRDGTERAIEDSAAPIKDAQGQILGVVMVFHDVSAKRRAEAALRDSQHRLAAALEIAQLGVWEYLPDAACIQFDQRCGEIFGREDQHAMTIEQFLAFVHEEDRQRVAADIHRALDPAGAGLYDTEYRIIRPDGAPRWIASRGHAIFTSDRQGKRLVRAVGTGMDITERKRAEDEIKEAQRRAEHARGVAEAASRAKDQFIAVLSHELRTPLTPALAAVSMMEADNRLPGDTREDLAMVRRNIALEVRLIADLLDVSRIISGKLHLEKRPMDVASAIREAVQIVSGDLDAKGQTLTIESSGAAYLTFGDAARLQQVFWNLLRNASKFAPHRGRIVIRTTVAPVDHCPLAAQPCPVGLGDCPLPQAAEGDPGAPGCGSNLTVEVSDNGSGIAPEMLPRLFNAFEQADEARTFGGLGLGLSICKAVVEMHGGTISAHSAGIGKGATFTVQLPIAQCPKGAPCAGAALPAKGTPEAGGNRKPQAPEPVRAVRILLVEDHADTARLMKRVLMADGHEVTLADSVAAGLTALQQRAGELDLLISDLGLPDGSGHDLMRQLRAQGKSIPGIALSGFGTAADIQQSMAAGFAEHLVKPTSPDLVAAAIQRATGYRNNP